MAITNVEFVKFLKAMVGQPYWYGTCVYKCTNSLLASKSKQYPTHYTDTRMSKYKSHVANKMVAADCVGLGKGFVWTDGGKGVLESIGNDKTYTRKYGANGCPDKAADSMFAYAKSKGLKYGPIATIPEVPGLAVRKSGHVGYYIGNGLVVEAEGFSWGIVTTQLSKRPWTDWYEFPGITYVEGAIIPDDNNNNAVTPTPTPTPIKPAVEPIAYAKVTTVSGRLNLRKQPKAGSTILVRIPQNERIPVYEKLALWSKVSYGTVTGYVMNEFLTFEEKQETEEITATQATIRKGASGDAVKIMQEKLIALGYNLGSYGADCKFGSRTDAAIRAFQKANGLKVDGICGPKTWEALVNAESKD